MFLENWFVWIGLFAFITILIITLRKPTRNHVPKGPFDKSIHTKPIFKVSSVFLVLIVVAIFLMRP